MSSTVLIEERARAKINLTLEVVGRRDDGYHALASLVAFASAADVVTLDLSRATGVDVTGPFAPQLPSEFLIARTLHALATHEPRLRLGAITLDKRLPVAAGVGGGSADAAAVLRAVRRANPEYADTLDWHQIACGLGADVPACFADAFTFMTGIGDRLQPLPQLAEPIPAVLVNPRVAVPADKTARVFRALDAAALTDTSPPQPPRTASLAEIISAITSIGNDLEAPARTVMPVIADVLAALRDHTGCQAAQMSGAGPTCFGVFADHVSAAAAIKAAHPQWWVEAVEIG